MIGANPKKSLGQHWLHDEEVLESMCDGAAVDSSSMVLEIGPGLGTLTTHLLKRGARVKALEFDHDLAENLIDNISKTYGDDFPADKLNVIEGDIRTFDFNSMPEGYVVCANIPYYLTSNLIRLLCDSQNKPQQVALLMQKEVAERIASDGVKMGLISCIAQFHYECHLSDIVPARLFTPPPKVDSQILVMVRRNKPMFDVDTKTFFRLMKAGFSEKRKTLRNALSGGLSISKDESVLLLDKSKIDPMRRGETLNLEEWKRIYDNLDVLSK